MLPRPCAPTGSHTFMSFSTASVSLLMLSLLAQGCVGIEGLGVRTKTFEDPSIADVASANGAKSHLGRQTNAIFYTADWLNAHWGEAGTIKQTGEGNFEEVWIY